MNLSTEPIVFNGFHFPPSIVKYPEYRTLLDALSAAELDDDPRVGMHAVGAFNALVRVMRSCQGPELEWRDMRPAPKVEEPPMVIIGQTFQHRQRLRAVGATWDAGQRAWLITRSAFQSGRLGDHGLKLSEASSAAR